MGLAATTALATVGVGFASWAATIGTALGVCGGDGGDPYSARGSTAGRFCDSGVSDVYFLVLLVVPALTMLVVGVQASVRPSWKLIWVGLGASVVLLLALTAVPNGLPAECAPDKDPNSEECQTY